MKHNAENLKLKSVVTLNIRTWLHKNKEALTKVNRLVQDIYITDKFTLLKHM